MYKFLIHLTFRAQNVEHTLETRFLLDGTLSAKTSALLNGIGIVARMNAHRIYGSSFNRNVCNVHAVHRCRINQVKSLGLLIFQHGNKNLTLE